MKSHFKNKGEKMSKLGTLEVGRWFYLNNKWYSVLYVGKKNVKAGQIGSPKQYTFPIDTEVKPQ